MGRLESTVDNCTGSSSINTHATYNGGFTGIFYVVNTGTTSSPFTLSFYKESDGSALSVPLLLPQTGTKGNEERLQSFRSGWTPETSKPAEDFRSGAIRKK